MSILALATATVASLGSFSSATPPYAALGNMKYKADIATVADVDYFKATLLGGEKLRAKVERAKGSLLQPDLDLENAAGQSMGIQLSFSTGRAQGKRASFPWKQLDRSGTYTLVVRGRNGTNGAYDADLQIQSRGATSHERTNGRLDGGNPRLVYTFEGMEGAPVTTQIKWKRTDTPLRLVSLTDPDGQPVAGVEGNLNVKKDRLQLKKLPLTGRLGTYTLVFEQDDAGDAGNVESETNYAMTHSVSAPERPKTRDPKQLDTEEPSLDQISEPLTATPGTNVQLRGENFSAEEGVTVLVDDQEATVCCVTETVIEITMPETDADGEYDVTIINADSQTVTETEYLAYTEPQGHNVPPPPAPEPDDGGGSTTPEPGGELVLPADPPTGDAVAVITARATVSNYVPFTVYVHATGSTPGAGNWQEARFEWSFGDSATSSWTTTDPRSGDTVDLSNDQEGFNAAYVYESPGQYQIRLRMTNAAGETVETTKTVMIGSSTRTTRYVDAESGSDSNDGTSPSSAWRSFSYAMGQAADDTAILFKRGQTFTVSNRAVLAGVDNVLVGTYGTGSKPTIRHTSSTTGDEIILVTNGSTGVIIRDLRLEADAALSGTNTRGLDVNESCTRTTILDCDFYGTSSTSGFYRWVGATGPEALLVANCSGSIMRSYAIPFAGKDHSYIGNTIPRSIDQFIMRGGFGIGMTRINNSWCTLDADVTGRGTVRYGVVQYGYLFGCLLKDGVTEIGHNDEDTDYIVVAECELSDNIGAMGIKNNAMNIMIRDNVFRLQQSFRPGIYTTSVEASGTYPIANLEIRGNLFVEEGPNRTGGQMLKLEGGSVPVINVTIADNEFRTLASSNAEVMRLKGSTTESLVVSDNRYTTPNARLIFQVESDKLSWSQWVAAPYTSGESLE